MVLERKVFMAIIAMCRNRIVSRARLGTSESKKRLTVFLEEASDRLQLLKEGQNKAYCQEILKRLVERMSTYCECYKVRSTGVAYLDGSLADIIDDCCQLSEVANWKDILLRDVGKVAPRMNPCELDAIVNMVGKLAQYKFSAERLVKVFRSQPIARRAATVLVQLSNAAFERQLPSCPDCSLSPESVFGRISVATNSSALDFGRVVQALHKSQAEVETQFRKSLRRALLESRIHAEMQLIWHIDSNPSQTRPRLLASNKDACYLCNAFISFHGMHTIPRTHGRIYPGWRLPAARLVEVRESFARELERMVIFRAREVLNGARRLDDPLESTVNSSMGSLTTMLTAEEALDTEEPDSSDSEATIMPEDGGAPTTAVPGGSSDAHEAKSAGSAGNNGISVVDFASGQAPDDAASGDRGTPRQSRPSSPAPSHSDDDGSWGVAVPDKEVVLRLSDRLRLHVEYSTAMASRRRLKFRAKQVSQDEAMRLATAGEAVYDVHRLPPWQDVVCRSDGRGVNLKAGRDMFRIELR
jgi:hypothetical protein